jgi:hypothetical protein
MYQEKILIIVAFGLNLTLLLPGPGCQFLFKEEGFFITFASPYYG